MALYRLTEPKDLIAPTMVAAFDGWVDAGSAATTAAAQMAEGGELVATFEGDQLFDYRARRPTLDIRDGRMTSITWRELTIRRLRLGERDLLVLTGVGGRRTFDGESSATRSSISRPGSGLPSG